MRAWIENQYGENVTDLEIKGEDEFYISNDDWACLQPAFFCEGDMLIIKVSMED